MSSLYIYNVTSSETIDLGYDTFLVDATGGNITVTIPTSPGDGSNFMISRIDSSSNTVTVVPTSADINGSSSVSLGVNENAKLGASNGDWWTVLGTWLQ